MRIAINGFGRIGKAFLRALLRDPRTLQKITIVACNIGSGNIDTFVNFFKYDSTMGKYQGTLEYINNNVSVENQSILILAETNAKKLPWKELAIDWVIDCSGHYTDRDQAEQHRESGAKKVLITAPAKNEDCTIIVGINDCSYKKEHTIVSLGSCTTNALVPLLKIILEITGIETAMAVTTHAYTNSQELLDSISTTDPRKNRSATTNIIPTTTGSSELIGKIIPELYGKVTASALRVPVTNVSLLEVTWIAPEKISGPYFLKTLSHVIQNKMDHIVAITDEMLVSSDYMGNKYSLIIDLNLAVFNNKMGKICGWYDNEWAYSMRIKDFLLQTL